MCLPCSLHTSDTPDASHACFANQTQMPEEFWEAEVEPPVVGVLEARGLAYLGLCSAADDSGVAEV